MDSSNSSRVGTEIAAGLRLVGALRGEDGADHSLAGRDALEDELGVGDGLVVDRVEDVHLAVALAVLVRVQRVADIHAPEVVVSIPFETRFLSS